MQDVEVLVVGAGAAGLATAIFAARCEPAPRIGVVDGARKIGAKILVSGGGRCNVTNARVTTSDFYGGNPNVIRGILAAFSEQATRRFFSDIGVPLHEEEHGKLFPDSNSARTVLAALMNECERLNVPVLPAQRVNTVSRRPGGFDVVMTTSGGGRRCRCRRLVLATGGLSLPKTGSDGGGYALAETLGHTLVGTTPALDPLLLSGTFQRELSGIAHDMQLTLHRADDRPVRISGPVLWTHFGLSGPAALNMSRFWNRAQLSGTAARLTASFVGDAEFAAIDHILIEASREQPKSKLSTVLRRWLPARVAAVMARELDIDAQLQMGRLSRDQRRQIVHAMTAWPVPVVGTRGYNYAEVTAGGIPLSELNPKTMESRCCPGLYLVGEVLDVDGRIGGFNFQWAWSSGFVAGSTLGRLPAAAVGQPSI